MSNFFELCKGRHAINFSDGCIFTEISDPTDVKAIEKQAEKFIMSNNEESLNIIVTGLSVALVAIIKAAKKDKRRVILWHFDAKSVKEGQEVSIKNYFRQEV